MKRALAIDGVLEPDRPASRKQKPRRKPTSSQARQPMALSTSWLQPPGQQEARVAQLLPLCRPAEPSEASGAFAMLGILPHGKPLFLDGSTVCAGCNRVMFYEHLTNGKCLPCAACRHYASADRPDYGVTPCLHCGIVLEHHTDPAAEYQKESIRRAAAQAERAARQAKAWPWT